MQPIIAALLLVFAAPLSLDPLFDPVTGYRIASYRGVVDRVPHGVTRIDTAHAAALAGRALFLDVSPAEGAIREIGGHWRLARPHQSIPGAHWFPEAGRGVPPPGIAAGFDAGVIRLTRGQRDRRIVVFCLADCWMSWNAALRLKRAGYTRVSWFADGLDGWKEQQRPFTEILPF